MSFIAGILTFFLVVNCAVLVLLILIQLPKKDAGAGMAFGGAAADALFGAGSGNVLTKVTKWAVVVFFGLVLILGYMQTQLHSSGNVSDFEKQVKQKQMQLPMTAPQPVTPPVSQPPAAATNTLLSVPLSVPTNSPAAPVTAPVEPAAAPAAPTQSK